MTDETIKAWVDFRELLKKDLDKKCKSVWQRQKKTRQLSKRTSK